MKRIIFSAMILVVMTSAGCAGFKADLAAADARREAREAEKHGRSYYGKKQLAEEPGEKVAAPAPVVTEQMLPVACKSGVAQYVGSGFMGKKFNDNTVEFTGNGILISKNDSFGGGIYSDFYYHPNLDVVVEKVFASDTFAGIKKGTHLRSQVHIIDSEKTGNHNNGTINFQSTYKYNKTLYGRICTDNISEISLKETFIRSGYLKSMTYGDLTDKDSETLQGYQSYQYKKSFENIIQKYSGEKIIKDPVAFITKLLVPATKARFEADLMSYFAAGGK